MMKKTIPSVITYDQRDPAVDKLWQRMCVVFGGYPDKTISAFNQPPLNVVCLGCRRSFLASYVDLVVNRFVVCPMCEWSIAVPGDIQPVIPDMGGNYSFNKWWARLYNN